MRRNLSTESAGRTLSYEASELFSARNLRTAKRRSDKDDAASSAQYRILALWAVPRSVSTAFERMMVARGDFTVFNEPFSACYYFGPDRVSARFAPESPSDDHDPAAIVRRLRDATEQTPVFFKDMAYHVRNLMSVEFLAQFTNTLLIRDPALAIPSLYKRMPDFTLEETGYAELARLAGLAEEATGAPPPAIDGEALRAHPREVALAYCRAVGIEFDPDALTWKSREEPHWERWRDWFQDAAQSTGFDSSVRTPALEILAEPRVAEAIAHCRPYYERLRELCIHG